MNVKRFSALVLMLGALAPTAASAAEGDARALAQRASEALPKVPFEAKVKLTTPQGPRELELKQKVVDGTRKGYLEVVGPADLKGIRHLFLEPKNEPPTQFLKLTASRSIVRVADEVRSQPFLGSTFYIADLVEPPLDAYTHTFVGDAEVAGRYCKLVQSIARDPANEIYSKIVTAIDPKELVVMRREFFDKKGAPLKVWQVEKLEKIDGIWTPRIQDMRNTQDKTESRLEVVEIKYNAQLDDSIFTPEYLKR
ncbi:MAG TPA: outer membrane lipoprotein-sorting protein [Terriglobales bacterium]|nr:outer membrane lipoprotein-sorting protein [Terriglobales bacterium]